MNFPETSSFLNIFNLLQFRDLKKEKKKVSLWKLELEDLD